ncbi:hypothetical protein KSP39_PZI015683 [Platanthera zijinensis]|uniref:Uncharacterized protein n=1 Tax=Platanthera zijinensis TaxID=2320716 RepID=A0AAP0B8M5_9ASPA
MSKVWVGAWALESERAEAEERQRADAATAASLFSSGFPMLFAGEPAQSFPSLQDAATKPKKKKSVPLKSSDVLSLPTGPRERTAEELEQSRVRGAFRYHGYGTGGGNDATPSRRRPDFSFHDNSSRASTKKFTPTLDSDRQERHGFIRNVGASKADGVDNWSIGKKFIAPPPPNTHSGFGSGFRDSVSRPDPPLTRPSPFGAARPREEVLAEKGLDWRKMETEIELKKGLSSASSQSSRPSSVQSSRPGSSVSHFSGEGAAPSPRPPKVNPFGNAKPREFILEEKGMDWRKIDLDLEHRGVDRLDTDEEKILKEEINSLRDKFAKETERQVDCDYAPSSTEQISSLLVQIGQREKELTQLICELDDKVRFRKRVSMEIRPGPDSGRIPSFASGPPSQSGSSSDSKNTEFTKRLPSRKMNDKLSRSLADRCGFQRRDSGFLASRSLDRYAYVNCLTALAS